MDNLNGHPRVVYVTGASAGAGATTVSLRPDAGKIWKILLCNGYHGAGGNRDSAWFGTDPENPGGVQLSPTVSLATAARFVLGSVAANTVPLVFEAWWATNYHYFSFLWTAVGAGENGYVVAEVLEYTATGKLA